MNENDIFQNANQRLNFWIQTTGIGEENIEIGIIQSIGQLQTRQDERPAFETLTWFQVSPVSIQRIFAKLQDKFILTTNVYATRETQGQFLYIRRLIEQG